MNENHIRLVIKGDSLAPDFIDGDHITVDTSINQVINAGYYQTDTNRIEYLDNVDSSIHVKGRVMKRHRYTVFP